MLVCQDDTLTTCRPAGRSPPKVDEGWCPLPASSGHPILPPRLREYIFLIHQLPQMGKNGVFRYN